MDFTRNMSNERKRKNSFEARERKLDRWKTIKSTGTYRREAEDRDVELNDEKQ